MTQKEREALQMEADLAKLQKREIELEERVKNPRPDENKRLLQIEADQLALINTSLMLKEQISATLRNVDKIASELPLSVSRILKSSEEARNKITQDDLEALKGERGRLFQKLESETRHAAESFRSSLFSSKVLIWVFVVLLAGTVGFSIWQNVRIAGLEARIKNIDIATNRTYWGLDIERKFEAYMEAEKAKQGAKDGQ